MTFFIIVLTVVTVLYALVAFIFFIGLFFQSKERNSIQYPVSIIIAARNEEDNIGRILQDLTQQTYPRALYEIIVANDSSLDSTGKIIDGFALKFENIKHVYVDKVPPGFSPKKYVLECAIQQAQNEIILTTDADCRVGSQWIESMVSQFVPNVGFVIGFSQFGKSYERRNLLERLQAFDFMQLMGAAAGTANLGYPLAASGQNLGYLRKAYLKVGGFKKVAHRVSGDDVLLLQLVRKFTKFKVRFAATPASFVVSEPQSNLKGFIQQRLRWASNGSYQIKLNIPFFVYLILVYLNNLFLFTGIILALFSAGQTEIILICLLIKILSEATIALRSSQLFFRPDLLRYFPLWFILQMPYIVLLGLIGSVGNFSWKGRSHSANSKINSVFSKLREYIKKAEDIFWKS